MNISSHPSINKSSARWILLAGALLALLSLSACQSQGIPASALLTPVHLRTQPTATPEPTFTATTQPTETPIPVTPTYTLMPSETPTPTDTSTPTISPTVTETPRFSPTFTRTPTRTLAPTRTPLPTNTRRPTNTSTFTPTPTPPAAYFRIRSPGSYSRIVSPIELYADALIGEDGYLNINLIGEDSRFIVRQALDFRFYRRQRITTDQEIPFEIPAAGETARLEISSIDPFGRIVGLASVELVLLKIGNSEIYQEVNPLEPYDIRSPAVDSIQQGGVVFVSGLARPVNDTPIIIELIDETGTIVGSAQFEPGTPSGGHSHIAFNVPVTYTVSTATPVRLTMRQESNTRIPGTVALRSILITLEP